MWERFWEGRGHPWEYDGGPAAGSRLGQLFAETPDYRALGLSYAGDELFRWHFGPMFYRGRLDTGDARVLVVGQEGAQDESLSHRSFTGGTGGRVQNLLRHMGVTRSYLFLNTFVYPIFGQYTDVLRPLAMDPRSPIASHRHAILDAAAASHPLRLVVAVGAAAKEAVAVWITQHGGTADPQRLHEAEASAVLPGLRAVGIVHPGAIMTGLDPAQDLKRALSRVDRWRQADRAWLPPDPDGEPRPAASFKYRWAPVPFADLPYGMSWRLGSGTTVSNRRDGQRGIQLFSADGSYNNTGQALTYPRPGPGDRHSYQAPDSDLAWEPPRAGWDTHHDPGPPPQLARLLMGGEPDLPWPDLSALGAAGSLGLTATYRGRLESPELLVLMDPADPDDVIHGRAAVGGAGQYLQGLLDATGVGASYGILATLPVTPVGASPGTVVATATEPAALALLGRAVTLIAPKAVLAVGPGASAVVAAGTMPSGIPAVAVCAHGGPGWEQEWRTGLAALRRLLVGASRDWRADRRQIPREDLPYGTLRWQATSGTRTLRPTLDGVPSRDYVKVVMPSWAAGLPAPSLPGPQRALVDELRP